MIKTLKRLLNNVKEQSLNVPGYKAKENIKGLYLYWICSNFWTLIISAYNFYL